MRRDELHSDPLELFKVWLRAADEAGQAEPMAMALATASSQGLVSLRHVLLKDVSDQGFLFFTDGRSRKAAELRANSSASLCFWWQVLRRQVTIEGFASPASQAEVDASFQLRARESQISSWASRQGAELEGRAQLISAVQQIEATYPQGALPTPEHWVGFWVKAERMEFWQQGDHRRHDRFEYRRSGATWELRRLSP